MTDHELIALAAKAMGVHRARWDYEYCRQCGILATPAMMWNPLEGAADAFHLAVALLIDITHNDPADLEAWVSAEVWVPEPDGSPRSLSLRMEDVADETQRPAAARRAIVRCAAAIGEAMP